MTDHNPHLPRGVAWWFREQFSLPWPLILPQGQNNGPAWSFSLATLSPVEVSVCFLLLKHQGFVLLLPDKGLRSHVTDGLQSSKAYAFTFPVLSHLAWLIPASHIKHLSTAPPGFSLKTVGFQDWNDFVRYSQTVFLTVSTNLQIVGQASSWDAGKVINI